MAGRVQSAVLIAVLSTAAAEPAPPSLLAGYSFDNDDLATGPDTFAIFEKARGRVRLSGSFRVSGYRSIEIQDAPGDGDFPELQGYFPAVRSGRLFAHFSFLTTDPGQELNIALAGPKRFQLGKDGISFWLLVEDGALRHMSDSIPKRLGRVDPFVWYTVDVDYDVREGRYDLRVQAEGATEPLAMLRDQKNAGDAPGSAVEVFSFVGDPDGDSSSVTYYVDDVVIGTSEDVRLGPLVAPGRRKLFIDSFHEYRRREAERRQCLPAVSFREFGIDDDAVRALAQSGGLAAAEKALQSGVADRAAPATVRAIAAWTSGCSALAQGKAQAAHDAFVRALEAYPQGTLYRLSQAIALMALERLDDAEGALAALYPDLHDDPRYAVVAGLLGTARGDLPRAREAVREVGEAAAEAPGGGSATLRVADLYYFVLLRNEDYALAREYAQRMADRPLSADAQRATWLERAGDAAFYARLRYEAKAAYERASRLEPEDRALWLKLADVAFLDGDLARERSLRERVYGALR